LKNKKIKRLFYKKKKKSHKPTDYLNSNTENLNTNGKLNYNNSNTFKEKEMLFTTSLTKPCTKYNKKLDLKTLYSKKKYSLSKKTLNSKTFTYTRLYKLLTWIPKH
jgi:hypothetical protein